MKKAFSKVLLLASSISLSSIIFLGTAADALFREEFPTLRSGSSGGYVRALQANLWSSGYQSTVGTVDGSYGSGTTNAVKAFQSREGLTSDGVAGSGTWSRMDTYVMPTGGYGQYRYLHPGSTTYETIYSYYATNVDVTMSYYLQYRSNGNVVSSGLVFQRWFN
ncbi:peptidoglycan-binding domain-containing protein [Paenibacillus lactis]|uniref:Peptidoglycan hydrolase-like protein with peptidoglycan-binding domain n=1 Tax=Paenibacillus lactis TaxID=228574 RepID=A0ABS4FKT6_9BACL|nr:peptidoglycan-binding domain-containing protein [Paenibacillus lactis]MBP1896877.1 peptidoglycan hydrolase-like protein with peptidoglycan-binding domain [Paenibacillus lactis]